jgi:hypothetical protein
MTRAIHPLLIPIVAIYLALGAAYAVYTPTWQVPDEPAHYNYIVELATTGRLPVLEFEDYPYEYLTRVVSARFPPTMSVDTIRYEAHQPPLYYALAVPVFRVTAGLPLAARVLTLRLISVVLGAALLVVTYWVVETVFPGEPTIALTATALVAFIPMHVTMTAAVNNDALAELLIAAMLLVSLRRLRGRLSTRGYVLGGGVLYGLALLTKTTAYPAVVILLLAEVGRWWIAERGKAGFPIGPLVALVVIALTLSSWWFVRNAVVYGDLDVFGLKRHDLVVAEQPRTAQWIARFGPRYVLWAFVSTTFKSFWGVFGWMGVPMDNRVYLGLLALTLAGLIGLLILAVRLVRRPTTLSSVQWAALGLLALSILLTASTYVWYNLTFVQHQGRYLFPALVPIALFFTLGLHQWVPRRLAGPAMGLLVFGLIGLDILSLTWFIIPNL